MKSDIENFKHLLKIEDDGGIGGKGTCVQLIAKNQGHKKNPIDFYCGLW